MSVLEESGQLISNHTHMHVCVHTCMSAHVACRHTCSGVAGRTRPNAEPHFPQTLTGRSPSYPSHPLAPAALNSPPLWPRLSAVAEAPTPPGPYTGRGEASTNLGRLDRMLTRHCAQKLCRGHGEPCSQTLVEPPALLDLPSSTHAHVV